MNKKKYIRELQIRITQILVDNNALQIENSKLKQSLFEKELAHQTEVAQLIMNHNQFNFLRKIK